MINFNVLKSVDFDLLDKQINIFIKEKGKNPHIFVNSKTLRALMNPIDEALYENIDNPIFVYCDCKVYIDPDLDYGVVELR